MSIRLRLTLLYSAIVALTLLAFSALLYVLLPGVTTQAVKDRLATDAARIIQARQPQYGQIVLPVSRFAAPETYAQTLTLEGKVGARTQNLEEEGATLPLSQEGMEAVQAGKPWTESAVVQGQRLLVYSKPVRFGEVRGVFQIASSLEAQDRSLNNLRKILLAGSGIATLLAFGIGWLLAGAALRPINRIARTARAIGEERDFDRRVDYRGPNDEVGRLATTFNTMLSQLGAAYQAQRRLVADASHELRTPLTTIRGNLALLQREPPISPDDRAAVLTDTAEETERMSRLVNDLLLLARADAGRPLQRGPVRVRPLMEELCRQAEVLGPDHGIECDTGPDLVVTGDRDALKQVLLILLDNALRFTPRGGTVSLFTSETDHTVMMGIRDTGPGIRPEVLPHIFERFYQADRSRAGGGAGLGLSIAKALVEAQGGSLSVESEVGKGSIFAVSLPRSATVPDVSSELQPARMGERSKRPSA